MAAADGAAPAQQQQQLGVCPRGLTSDVSGRLSKLSSLLSRKASNDASRERQDAALLSELSKMRCHIEARVNYLRGQAALASAEDIDVEEALLFGSGDFLEDQLFPSLEDEVDLFSSDFLVDLPQQQQPTPEPAPEPQPVPPPPAKKRKRVDEDGKKKKKKTRSYVRVRLRCQGHVWESTTASILSDSPFALTLSSNQLQKRKKAVPQEEQLDPELGPPTRTENGATAGAVWAWLEDAYRKADLPQLLRDISHRPDDENAPYSVSPLLSSLLADDDDEYCDQRDTDRCSSAAAGVVTNNNNSVHNNILHDGFKATSTASSGGGGLARRLVAALVPPSDTLTARQQKSSSAVQEENNNGHLFSSASLLDRDGFDRCLLASCSEAGLDVVDDQQRFDSPLYVEARLCAAKLRRAQARNSTLVANLAYAFSAARDRDLKQAKLDRVLDLRWKRLQKKQSGELKKKKAQAKALRKAFLPW